MDPTIMLNDLDLAKNFAHGRFAHGYGASFIIGGKTPAYDIIFGCDGGENPKTDTPYQKPPFGPLLNSKHWQLT